MGSKTQGLSANSGTVRRLFIWEGLHYSIKTKFFYFFILFLWCGLIGCSLIIYIYKCSPERSVESCRELRNVKPHFEFIIFKKNTCLYWFFVHIWVETSMRIPKIINETRALCRRPAPRTTRRTIINYFASLCFSITSSTTLILQWYFIRGLFFIYFFLTNILFAIINCF